MSNNSSSDVVARIQPSTLVFVVLVLIVGALLLATTGIDSRATVRASLSATPIPPTLTSTFAPTINAYASAGYKTYTSPDNILKIEYPDQWTPVVDPNSPLTYVFSPGGNQNTSGTLVVIQVGNQADLVSGLTSATLNSTPREVLTIAFSQTTPPVTITDVKAGNYSGAGVHQQNPPRQGTPTNQERELWVLTIDPAHVAVIQATALPGEWGTKLQPIFQHMMNSMSFDSAAITKASGTPAATVAATQVATQLATQAPTTLATIAATQVVTKPATATATIPATSAATQVATQAATDAAISAMSAITSGTATAATAATATK